jgi:glucokinase
LGDDSVSLDRRGGAHVIDQVERITRRLADRNGIDWRQVRFVAIGSPGTVDPASGVIRRVSNVAQLRDLNIRDVLRSRFDVPVLVDNEVNMSVLGERWLGHGRDCGNFIALELGTGVGLGLVLEGQIYRGFGGAAGEVAFLPLGGDPFDRSSQRRGVYENACCGAALLRRYAEAGGQATTVPALFDAAAAGDRIAHDALDEQARLVALGLTAATSLLDPELVVLGGGIGSRPELLEPVRHWLGRLVATPPRVETSALGNRATLVGAVAAALTSAHQSLFGAPGTIPQPAIEHHRELMSATAGPREST